MEFHGYLDRFSIIGHCLVAEGWANHAELELWYDDAAVACSVTQVHRPELVPIFGQDAASWGFSLCAALPWDKPERSKFRLKFNAGMTLSDPAQRFSRADDTQFEAMTKRFRDAVNLRKGPLLEIGSRARSGAAYRHWFPPDIEYVGFDVTDGPNVDIVGDAHHLSRYVAQSFDFIFSMAVFEHLLMPWKVALEMNKVMTEGGLALIISHGAWPLHEEPWDFFRFSKESWAGIFNAHTGFAVLEANYQHQASIVPHYIHSPDFEAMSAGPAYLLSGCLVRKVSAPQVAWDAEVGEVYNLGYNHS